MMGIDVAREEVEEELAERRRPLDYRSARRFEAGVRGEQCDQLGEVGLAMARGVREGEVAVQRRTAALMVGPGVGGVVGVLPREVAHDSSPVLLFTNK